MCAGPPAPRSLAALIPSSLVYTLLWPVAAARSPGAFRAVGRRAVRRLVAAFAPRAAQTRTRRSRPIERRPEPARSRYLPVTAATALTIVIVDHWDVHWDATAVVTRLAELAVNDELVVVFGSNERRSGPHAPIVTAGLRDRLPRHDVVSLHVAAAQENALRRGAALVGEFLEIGSLPIVVTPAAVVCEVAERLSAHLRADRVLTVSCTTGGADLYHVWPRPVAAGAEPACLAR
ncbi:hypothetical protein Vau01_023620 [Virgisporangium aurantiacum]|uniref:Uncharacterized protein n=1 Tax=Virgisporangium aurantiacum TaxID=175570 RepID=A0A8J3Z400_9ACTN|nr:hypothetical protein Vau01_023620 [Virgisporangium aurantiacum]